MTVLHYTGVGYGSCVTDTATVIASELCFDQQMTQPLEICPVTSNVHSNTAICVCIVAKPLCNRRKRTRRFCNVRSEGAHPLYGALSRRGSDPIELIIIIIIISIFVKQHNVVTPEALVTVGCVC